MPNYQNQRDEELILRLRQGDQEIMDHLLTKYKPLVLKKAKSLFLIGGETEDLIQEGMIGLFQSIQGFDEKKEASFFYFADLCITRQMYTAVEASQRKKHAPLNSYVSLYESKEEGNPLLEYLESDWNTNPETMVIYKENFTSRILEVKKRLSPLEKQVFDYILDGMNYQQIAVEMKKPLKSIDNAIQRIRQKMIS
ncbi:MAG: sigma-70 family RNA polymerase sigma factor [Lachnospiraceae bacterium]